LFIDRFTAQQGEGIVLLHGYGNVFEKNLAPGEQLDVEPGAWLWRDSNVRMDTVSVLSSQGGGGLLGALGAFVGGSALQLNRFTGPGRIGIQSMTYHAPGQQEGATQTGGQSNVGNVLGSLFGNQG
jgi:uncharacterized protein (AIM24 family)